MGGNTVQPPATCCVLIVILLSLLTELSGLVKLNFYFYLNKYILLGRCESKGGGFKNTRRIGGGGRGAT